jgi:predicted site-specific integrase-resolvase
MKPNESPKRSRKRDLAILALLEHATREQAAKAAGINPATLNRWMQDPEFQKAHLKARREVFGQAMGRLQQGANTAVDSLFGIMNDTAASVGGRVQAAKCVLELSRKSLDQDDLRIQVEELQNWRQAKQEGSYSHGEHQAVN